MVQAPSNRHCHQFSKECCAILCITISNVTALALSTKALTGCVKLPWHCNGFLCSMLPKSTTFCTQQLLYSNMSRGCICVTVLLTGSPPWKSASS